MESILVNLARKDAELYCRSLYEKDRGYANILQSILLKNKKDAVLKSKVEIIYGEEKNALDYKVLEKIIFPF